MTDAGTVAVTDHPFRDLDIERAIHEPRGYSVAEHQCGTADEVLHACADAVGVLNTYAPMPAEVIGRLERCRAIAHYGVGLDTIDLDAAKARALGLRVAAHDPFVADDAWPGGIERYAGPRRARLGRGLSLRGRATHGQDSPPGGRGVPAPHAGARRAAEPARGPLVDTEALDRALDEGWIGGAAPDLLETEPPVPDLALLGHEDLIVTAHQAFYSEEALRELQRKAAQNLLDGLEATS